MLSNFFSRLTTIPVIADLAIGIWLLAFWGLVLITGGKIAHEKLAIPAIILSIAITIFSAFWLYQFVLIFLR